MPNGSFLPKPYQWWRDGNKMRSPTISEYTASKRIIRIIHWRFVGFWCFQSPQPLRIIILCTRQTHRIRPELFMQFTSSCRTRILYILILYEWRIHTDFMYVLTSVSRFNVLPRSVSPADWMRVDEKGALAGSKPILALDEPKWMDNVQCAALREAASAPLTVVTAAWSTAIYTKIQILTVMARVDVGSLFSSAQSSTPK